MAYTSKQISEVKKFYDEISSNLAVFGYKLCEDQVTSVPPDFHMELCDLLMNNERIVLAAPRGFAKSMWSSKVYPLWCALFKKKKDICIISASEGLAVEHLRYIKSKVENDQRIISLFGDLRSDKWSETHIILNHPDGTKVSIRAKGAGGQIRGFRPDCIILDDIETDETVISEEQRKKLKQWLYTACINCLLPGGQLIFIGTVIHVLAILNDLLETDNKWAKRRWRAYKDKAEEAGNELWASQRPHEWLQQRKREIGSYAFASEYLNDPKMNDDAPIKECHIRNWSVLPSQYSSVISVDPAYSEDIKSDFKVATHIAIDQAMNRYVLSYIRTHVPTGEFIDAILNMYLQNKLTVTGIGVPSGGVEKMFYQSILRRAEERKIYAPFIELKNSFITAGGQKIREKSARITACLQPLFEQGKYYIGENQWELRDELLTIGNSRWDDLCFAGGTKIATLRGDIPIENICIGDKVITPYGFQKVIKCGCTGVRETINKFGVDVTPKHKIFSFNKGLVSMDSLCYNDVISRLNIKEILRWRYKKLLCSMEKSTVLWEARENITLVAKETIKNGSMLKDCMSRFGSFIINNQYQKAITFIISTVILLITTFLIYSVYRIMNIINFIKILTLSLLKNISKKLDHWLQNGINLKKVGSGIVYMLENVLRELNIKQENVVFAGNNLSQNIQMRNYVQEHANRKKEEIVEDGMSKDSVLFVEMSSQPINTEKLRHVQNHVDTNIYQKSEQKVYNLTVEKEGMYYANGLLVSNCDTLAYAEQILQPRYEDAKEYKFDDTGHMIEHEVHNNYGF